MQMNGKLQWQSIIVIMRETTDIIASRRDDLNPCRKIDRKTR